MVEAASPSNEEVEIIPLILVVSIPVEVAKEVVALEITLLVAITPLMLVVRVLPERD